MEKLKAAKKKILCYHCSAECDLDIVEFDSKSFCCNGCSTVYELITSSGLDDFYKLSPQERLSQKISSADQHKYAFLDNKEIFETLVDFQDGGQIKLSLNLPDIHCSSCIYLLENLNQLIPGIIHSKVDFIQKTISVSYNQQKTSLKEIAHTLDKIGYPPNLSLQSAEKKQLRTRNKTQILKLAVAGFAFGNIMLFSFPEYIGFKETQDDADFQRLFSYLNLAFSIPVFLYSASGYFSSAYKALKKKILHINVPLALGMLSLFARSLYEVISATGPGYFDSFCGLVFFLLIGKWFQDYSYQHLSFERDYRSYLPLVAGVKTSTGIEYKMLKDIKKGDRLVIKNEEMIPADGILLKGDAVLDYSFITGESIPVNKIVGEKVYAGGKQKGQIIEIELDKSTNESSLPSLWSQYLKNEPSVIDTFVNKVSHYFTISLLLIATLAFIYWAFKNLGTAFFVFTSILIVACPCALALSSPFAFGFAHRILGKNGLFLKQASLVENMSKTEHIVFDKTGTLTETNDYLVNTNIKNENILKVVNSICRQSNHPYSKAIAQFLKTKESVKLQNFQEIPGKGMTVNYAENNIHYLLKLGSSSWLNTDQKKNSVWVALDDQIIGNFEIESRYRVGIKNLFNTLGKKFKLSVISGDSKKEKNKLISLYNHFKLTEFELNPIEKLEIIKQLKEKEKVMMIGDGLNDAGALKTSDLGIVITENTNNFTPASDGIIEAKSLHKLSQFFSFSHSVTFIIKLSLLLSLFYNFVGITFAAKALLSPIIAAILMPISSVSVVAFNAIMINYYKNKHQLK